MSLIVAGRFDTFVDGERAAQALFNKGFVEEDVTMFFVNPRGRHGRLSGGGDHGTDPGAEKVPGGATKGAALGAAAGAAVGLGIISWLGWPVYVAVIVAGIGAYVGSLIGAVSHTHTKGHDPKAMTPEAPPVRESGVLLAVHVTEANRDGASRVLHDAGAHEVERAVGRWARGRWTDFDPLAPPEIEKMPGR